MNIPGLANLPAAAGAQQPAANAHDAAAGAPARPAADGGAQRGERATVPVSTLAQAVDKLQTRIGQQESSVALTAGLDTGGNHPGQLLVELKDNRTQQVFVRYYVPAEQVARAAGSDAANGVPPGTLLEGKA